MCGSSDLDELNFMSLGFPEWTVVTSSSTKWKRSLLHRCCATALTKRRFTGLRSIYRRLSTRFFVGHALKL